MQPEEMRLLIRETVNAVLDERNRIEADKHAADHAFIEFLRQKEKRKQKMWVSVKKNVLVFLVISALGGLGTLIWIGWLSVNHKSLRASDTDPTIKSAQPAP